MKSNSYLVKLSQFIAILLVLSACQHGHQEDQGGAAQPQTSRAVLVPGSGTYSRPISTDSSTAQAFFDQGLRLSWGFFFPEAIASHQEAARLDPDHPMPHWGMAQAMGPNPNSRYARMPDDPLGEGAKAIRRAQALKANGTVREAELIDALAILYDQAAIPDADARDRAYLDAARALHASYPEDPDIGALYAAAYMSIGRWDYCTPTAARSRKPPRSPAPSNGCSPRCPATPARTICTST